MVVWLFTLPKQIFLRRNALNFYEDFNDTIIVSGGCKQGADRYAKKYALELGLQYEEYPPFHEVHNLYCTMPESRYGRPYSVKNFFARNKIIAGTSDMVVGFIPEGIEGRGTLNTIEYAKKFKKKFVVIS